MKQDRIGHNQHARTQDRRDFRVLFLSVRMRSCNQARNEGFDFVVGILVHGDNHFIVSGPLPDRKVALALIRNWSLIQIGAVTPPPLDPWQIISREFRENLEWA